MYNRFIEMDRHLKSITGKHCRTSAKGTGAAPRAGYGLRETSASMSAFSRPFAAADRALVVLIENGGDDLGIPTLVEKILAAIPGSSLIPDSYKASLVEHIRNKIKSLTDYVLETAELAVNRYSAAAPALYGEVAILRDGTASYNDLKGKLITLSRGDSKIIDVLILTHGYKDHISAKGDIDGAKIRRMKDEHGGPLSIRSVYMMNCVGSSLNQAWLDAGAKVSSGSVENNYLPEPTMYFFWQNWKNGQTFENAATSAFRRTVNLMNETVRDFVRAIPIPGTDSLANLVDFNTFDFVVHSAPVIQGQRTVTIGTDDLTFTQSMSSSLATTVLPARVLGSLGGAGESALARSYSYRSPSMVMQLTRFSFQQNPAAVLIAGMEVADAASLGLSAVGLVQAQVSASAGSFTLTYDRASRLLTSAARAEMKGAQASKQRYSARLLWLAIGRANTAKADIIIEWEGNPYGEIGTPVIRKNLPTSTDWSKSSANVNITRVDRIPLPGTDPRTWPIVYSYEGTYDPLANGYFEFSGEFEVNAFGGLHFTRHDVVSHSLADWALEGTAKDYVQKGDDMVVPVPTIPQEQIDYLKKNLP